MKQRLARLHLVFRPVQWIYQSRASSSSHVISQTCERTFRHRMTMVSLVTHIAPWMEKDDRTMTRTLINAQTKGIQVDI